MRNTLFVLFLMLPTLLLAQKNNGNIRGVIYDSINDYALQSASISVFKVADSSIAEFQLSNTSGEFDIKNLPEKTSLYFVITHTGYRQFTKTFQIDSNSLTKDFGKIFLLLKNENELEEVTVKAVQPIKMNGDTLEINPDAFKLDSNAVVEDMLMRVPGLTVWSDGTITMNGRKMDKVYVDGKPFFGGAAQTATQNLPKNAIEKVQIYQEKDLSKLQNTEEKVDSLMALNIKLKADKKKGMFGKIGAGYGTDDRYTGDGVLQAFDKKNQFGIAAGINNINKEEGTGESAFEQNTFKSNFMVFFGGRGNPADGITQRTWGNLKWQHSFSESDNSQFYNRLTNDYAYLNTQKNATANTTSIQNINDYKLNTISNSTYINSNTSNTAKFMYENRKQFGNFVNLTANYTNQFNTSSNSSTTSVSRNDVETSSTVNTSQTTNTSDNLYVFGFVRSSDWGSLQDPRKNFMLSFNGGYNKGNNKMSTLNKFDSFIDTIPSNTIDRKYNTGTNGYNAGFDFRYDGLRPLLFGIYNFHNIDMSLTNNVVIIQSEQNSVVTDFDTISNHYIENALLTNQNTLRSLTYAPGLSLSKSFNKYLWEKYNYFLNISIDLQYQFLHQTNESSILQRNITRQFKNFTPRISVNYNYAKNNLFRINSSLWGNARLSAPTIDQLYPIVDSTNRYNITVGNPNLKAPTNRSLTWNFEISRNKMGTKSNYSANANFNYGNTLNAISDNVVYDSTGRSVRYLINVKNQENYRVGINTRFSNTLSKLTSVSFSYSANYSYNQRPGFVNNVSSTSQNTTLNNGINAQFNYIDKFNVSVGENISTNWSMQQSLNTITSKINNYTTSGNVNYFLTKSITLNTSLNYQSNIAANGNSVKASIWNANATYRFMQQKAELKFSAFDLLRRNKNITNFVANNTATTTITNGLQQYFMITFSYYPRKFGASNNAPRAVPSGIMIIR